MANKFSVRYLKDAARDYQKLDGSQKVFVYKAISRIQILGLNCGQPLLGDLIGYRKLKNRKMGLRIVFGQEKDTIAIIDIVAIGRRQDDIVYHNAVNRIKKDNHKI